ncbi:MAG: adenylosuccinate synthetase [Candidatus Undinarchaeales archaeon]
MNTSVIVGTQWGDEGKGKIVDYLSKDFDLVARFQGGNNAGHTVVVNGTTFKLHFIPSGIISGKDVCLGNGMVLEPNALLDEIKSLEKEGIDTSKITISERAQVITEKHKKIDGKDKKIGTTKKGIGPAYASKIHRKGDRIKDILEDYPELKKYSGDVSLKVNQTLKNGNSVLFEGAQGTLLDIDHGTYPFVTSSNTTAGGACTGTGIGPTKIDKVIGIAKAYTTRVGKGPFPTELENDDGRYLREKGKEFGTTTGRPRRCGWFDTVILNYAVRINGINEFALTKLDVLSGLDKIKICTKYKKNGDIVENLPTDISDCKPVYEEMPGWQDFDKSVSEKGYQALPKEAKDYIERIETLTGTKINLVSYGPARSDTFIKA